jgi:Nucleotidyl transferase AbiEii toxin, Type IV TA system
MSTAFVPRTDILPEAQRRLWADLGGTPTGFTLYGGTAIALRLGHRQSLDFDFFAQAPFEPDALLKEIAYLRGAVVRQSSPNTLTTTVDRGGPVQVSFFGGLGIGQVEAPDFTIDPKLAVASLIDLAGAKAKVIIQRVEPKDYIDIHALMTKGGIPLATMVAAACAIFGPQLNALDALKAIAYHQDPALAGLSERVKADLVHAVQTTDPENLPKLSPIKPWQESA